MTADDSDDAELTGEIEAGISRVKRWAAKCDAIGSISNLLELTIQRRLNLTAAQQEVRTQMQGALHAMEEGNMPTEWWELRLSLEQGFGDSHGTRIYTVKLNDEGIRAECFGSEWQKGVGSDSWSGPEFIFAPGRWAGGGDFYDFINEFEEALINRNFELVLLHNDDPAESNEEDPDAVKARQKLAKRLVSLVIRGLQSMQDPSMLISGQDSGLTNVWDEICVQRQTEESIHWAAFENIIRSLIDETLDDVTHNQLCALWLLSDAGQDWRFEHPGDQRPAPCKSGVVDYIFSSLLSKAENHTNARIRDYCDRRGVD